MTGLWRVQFQKGRKGKNQRERDLVRESESDGRREREINRVKSMHKKRSLSPNRQISEMVKKTGG